MNFLILSFKQSEVVLRLDGPRVSLKLTLGLNKRPTGFKGHLSIKGHSWICLREAQSDNDGKH